MSKILSYTIDAKDYERLVESDRKFEELSRLINANDPRFITVTMIANAYGISRQDAINRPWMLPNFGKTDNPSDGVRKKRFWRFDEYLDWVAIPEHERIKQFRERDEYL